MATTQTPASATPKTPKVKKPMLPLGQRLDSQITKSVLAGTMTHEELKKLADRMTRLHAFMTSDV